MNNTRWKMMKRLIEQAATAPALDNNESYKDPTTGAGVHGLVQCRRDLTTEECTKCLNDVVQHLLDSYLNHTAASLRGLSCYAKYHHEPITLMTVPEPPPDVVRLCVVFGRWKERFAIIANAADQDMQGQFRNGAGPKGFSYNELAAATGNFSDDQKLGEGGFGSVYSGFLDQLNLHVAIKRVSRSSSQGRKEYASEVTIISQLRHRNLVKVTLLQNGLVVLGGNGL
ncbi:cysteine-rich receptor-like protein kinase 37 [Miscanthus floridulus]|uniref:cysteine-rich receptor-like protein kinase 37 n=1 Tax=Miscanthus floridulus TaxID=154761 RepID=UPI00345AC469